MRVGFWAVLGLSLMAGLPVAAQTGPAEPPPEGFTGREYVDSKGCVFQRAGVSGTVIWVPRVDARNNPVCGLAPTVAPAAMPAAEPAPVAQAVKRVRSKAIRRAPAPALLVEDEALAARRSLCLADRGQVQRLWVSDGRLVTNCGKRAADGVAFVNGLGVPGLTLSGTDTSAEARARARALGARGYRIVWAKGPVRGGVTPEPVTTGHWVQAGAFADPANAARAAETLRALGLPVARQPLKGGRLTAILAGPFVGGDAQVALGRVRGAGYGDAYLR